MRRFFAPVIRPLLDAVRPRRIVEIGIAEGGHSALLAEWCQQHGGRLDLIDTAPRFDTDTFLGRFGDVAALHIGRSLDVLPRLEPPDVACIDGDHNWYTVFHELRALSAGGAMPICLFHDTGWPYGRRDLYYEPDDVPEAFRQPWQRGPIVPGEPGIAGAGLNPQLCHAVREGGPRNGVQTAIDDFVAEHPGAFRVLTLPVLFGFTVLVPRVRLVPGSPLEALLDALDLHPSLRALLEIEEAERCHAMAAAQRLAPLPRTPGAPYAGPVRGRSFSPAMPAEILDRVQTGTLRYRYRDRALLKSPFDLALYLRLLGTLRPRTIIEVGTFDGGSALWFADMQAALGIDGRVITIDREPRRSLADPRIQAWQGDATQLDACLAPAYLATLPRPWLVVDDAAHHFDVSLAILRFFDRWLAPGDYIVVEDGVVRGLPGAQYLAYEDGPSRAIEAFLAERGDDYDIDTETCDWFGPNVTYAPSGWLRRAR